MLRHATAQEQKWINAQFETLPLLPTPATLWRDTTHLGQQCRATGFNAGSLDLIIAALCIQIFNVELLNKNFYDELANWYFWAKKHRHFPFYDFGFKLTLHPTFPKSSGSILHDNNSATVSVVDLQTLRLRPPPQSIINGFANVAYRKDVVNSFIFQTALPSLR